MTALIETVRVMGGRAPLWPLHLHRIQATSAALGLDARLPGAPSGGADRVIRYELRDGETTTSTRDPTIPASLCLRVSVVPHADYSWKTTDRDAFEQAYAEARAAAGDDALLLSADGLVREASRWAIVWKRDDGRIGAPPLASGVLRSVARARLGILLEGGIVEEELEIEQIFGRPVAALNAARGLVPVTDIDGRKTAEWAGWRPLAACFWP